MAVHGLHVAKYYDRVEGVGQGSIDTVKRRPGFKTTIKAHNQFNQYT